MTDTLEKVTNDTRQSVCTVLVVDDDDVALEGVLRSFVRHDVPCNLVTATDGAEALAILQNRHPKSHAATPVINLIDLNMTNKKSFQFIHALRAEPKL